MTTMQARCGDVVRVEEGSLYPVLHRTEEAAGIRAEWITLHDSVHTTLVICGQWGGLDNDLCADSLDVLHTLASIENLR